MDREEIISFWHGDGELVSLLCAGMNHESALGQQECCRNLRSKASAFFWCEHPTWKLKRSA